MTEPTRDALHAETLAMLAKFEVASEPVRSWFAYAAECVRKRAELEAEVERLTASNRKLTTMLEEEAYHRMAAENRAEPDSGNVRIEITDSAEVERLRAKAAIVDAIDEGRIAQVVSKAGLKRAVMLWRDDNACFSRDTLTAAYAAATREGTE